MAYKDPLDERAREARRRHYEANRDQYKDRTRKERDRLLEILREEKAKPCTDCRESYPYYVMDFDHREGETKTAGPATLPRLGSEKRLREELAKCDVVCANCHRERTHQRMVAEQQARVV